MEWSTWGLCFTVYKDKLKIQKVTINNIEFYLMMGLLKCLGGSVLMSEIYFEMHLKYKMN